MSDEKKNLRTSEAPPDEDQHHMQLRVGPRSGEAQPDWPALWKAAIEANQKLEARLRSEAAQSPAAHAIGCLQMTPRCAAEGCVLAAEDVEPRLAEARPCLAPLGVAAPVPFPGCDCERCDAVRARMVRDSIVAGVDPQRGSAEAPLTIEGAYPTRTGEMRGPLDALQIVQRDRDVWKQRAAQAEVLAGEYKAKLVAELVPRRPDAQARLDVQGETEAVKERIVEWLRSLPAMQHPQALADAIEDGAHLRRERANPIIETIKVTPQAELGALADLDEAAARNASKAQSEYDRGYLAAIESGNCCGRTDPTPCVEPDVETVLLALAQKMQRENTISCSIHLGDDKSATVAIEPAVPSSSHETKESGR